MTEVGAGDARVRVRYAETDQMGVVYHSNYLVWFEIGRVEKIRHMGLDYRSMEAEGLMIAVVEVSVRYKAPARYDDELVVRTQVRGLRGSIVRFSYEVERLSDGLLLCTGETVHVVVGRDMQRRRLPESYAEAFRGAMSENRSGLAAGCQDGC